MNPKPLTCLPECVCSCMLLVCCLWKDMEARPISLCPQCSSEETSIVLAVANVFPLPTSILIGPKRWFESRICWPPSTDGKQCGARKSVPSGNQIFLGAHVVGLQTQSSCVASHMLRTWSMPRWSLGGGVSLLSVPNAYVSRPGI